MPKIRQKETISRALSLQKVSFKVKASGKRLIFNIFWYPSTFPHSKNKQNKIFRLLMKKYAQF